MKKLFISFVVILLSLALLCSCDSKPAASASDSATDNVKTEVSVSQKENSKQENSVSVSKENKESGKSEDKEKEESGISQDKEKVDMMIEKTEVDLEIEDDGILKVPSNSGRLHVDGIYIKNESNQVVQLKGLSTAGLQWFPEYVNNEFFWELRNEWNCNVIRLAMYTAEGGYCTGADKNNMKKLIKNGVKYATDNDMYVIIDWHILHDTNPNQYKAEAKKFFEEMSALYKDQNNVIYEICNEPNGDTTWKDIKKYAEEIIPVIRSNDENAIIIVGTPNWSQFVDRAAADPIKGYDNLMYTLHFYADTHKDDLRNTMKNALDSGLPIFVTEYGICDASGNGAINYDETKKWMELLDKYNISSCAWNISNKAETSSILKSGTWKKYYFSDSDLSASGRWVYTMLTGKEKYVPSEDRPEASTDNSNNGGNNGGGGNNSQPVTIPADSREIVLGDFTAYLVEVNSWSSGDGNCHQYSLTLVNNGSDASSWTVTIPFDKKIKFLQGWGGIYASDGKKLTISNESYNGSMSTGCGVKDIGFIIAY